ncbi:hypothetical protein phytr_9840 [Candidatus Phycorickettsia trachydisci]|uniref:Uncharacterized protein n=1 Tax=Candidatus Phycorickettsia trachydisci TaxID=2115978 RepID=A0A2P1P9G5_9RICK|nr:hypothetical protein [Candidatus Phycorickettsia trachydisci]AVP87912.1 hypothetical protein phytr_9840 [Candidatus Phycorickettsia trachydisci]
MSSPENFRLNNLPQIAAENVLTNTAEVIAEGASAVIQNAVDTAAEAAGAVVQNAPEVVADVAGNVLEIVIADPTDAVEANTIINRIREFANFSPRELFDGLFGENGFISSQPTSVKIAAALAVLGACGAIGMVAKSLYTKSSDAVEEQNDEALALVSDSNDVASEFIQEDVKELGAFNVEAEPIPVQ